MKKAVILFALLLAGAFALTACGGDNNSSETPSGQVEMETKKATEKATEKPTQKPTEKPTKKLPKNPLKRKRMTRIPLQAHREIQTIIPLRSNTK